MRRHDFTADEPLLSAELSVEFVQCCKEGIMPSTEYAVSDGCLVTFSDIQREETGLTCYPFGD